MKPGSPGPLPGLSSVGAGVGLPAVRAGRAAEGASGGLTDRERRAAPADSRGAACSVETGLDPWVWKSSGGGSGYTPVLLPGESHGQGSLQATVHGLAKSQTMSAFHFHC